jgi:hypothetical protein
MILPGGKIIHVPPRGPEVFARVVAAAHLEAVKVAKHQQVEMLSAASSLVSTTEVMKQLTALVDVSKNECAVMFVSAGVKVDGGGIGITPSGHVIRIPPWDPGVKAKLELAAQVYELLPTLHEPETAAQYATFVAHTICDDVLAAVNRAVE